uniref:SLAM n=1 Tax=Cochliomyia hominivorax TaxID=115425 RepID=A0A0E3M3A6_COLHO|nr:SLAM [Cochliomyia hominivorax]
MVAPMTREEIFECTNIDDDQFLKGMEHETSYEVSKDRVALVSSIENLMKYFDEDVTVRDDSLVKASPVKKLTKGKVASAVASFRNKYNLTPSPLSKRKKQQQQQQQMEVKANIQELKKKYETSMDTDASPSPKSGKTRSPKLTRKNKVKQMALLFNNKINSIIRNSSPEPQTPPPVSPGLESIASSIASPNFTSTLKLKSPKFKSKFPKFVAKLPSPKPSPLFKRKQLQKSPSITSSLGQSPLMSRKQLEKQPSTTCLVAESVFSQLSVKDKALLYNQFIADMSKHNPKFSKHAEVLESNVKKEIQRGEVICEKQSSVKYLRDSLEAKLTPTKALSKTLQRFKRSNSKLALELSPKAKEYEDLLQGDMSCSQLVDDSQDLLHVSTLTVVLKSSPDNKKTLTKNKSQRKKKDVTFSEDNSIIEPPSHKRTQTMIRSSFCVEPYAPPKKIRRTQHERLAPKMFFQNQHLEKLFYHWLKEKNGVAFDITAADNQYDIIEIVPKNSRDKVLPAQEVNEILEAAINKLESKKEKEERENLSKPKTEDAIALIKNTLENEKSLEKSVIEVELPLEVEIEAKKETDEAEAEAENKANETIESDLGFTSINKTTSEDSLTEFNSPEVSNLAKRKKKLKRSMSLRKDSSVLESNALFSTDSDSDCKPQTEVVKIQSCTLPKSRKCSNYVKKLVFKTLNSSMPAEPHSSHLNNELSILELDRSLIRQVNSPSKIKNAYTLTVMSSPSPQTESDFYDSDLPRTPIKEASRSWPSLLEAQLEDEVYGLKGKAVSTEFTDMAKSKMEQEQQKLLMDSFIDQGFETGSNDMDSPMRLPRKLAADLDKSVMKRENPKIFSTPLKDKPVNQVFTALQGSTTQAQVISPIANDSSPQRPASLTMTVIKEDTQMEDSQEMYNTPSSLNDSNTFFATETTPELGVTHKVETSQFWITSGDFTAAITIHHYEAERLMLLSNIFAQKSLDTKEMNFGIDQHKFIADNSPTSDDIIKKVPQENNCSQYWFSTGDVLIPFSGKQMSSKKIQSFFRYIREFLEDSGSLRFGIDSYEFSNIYQHNSNCSNHFMANTWSQAVSSLKTSDLDQSDIDSEEFEQSLTFSGMSGHHSDTASLKSDDLVNPQLSSFRTQHSSVSLEQIFEDARHLNLSKTQTDKQALEAQFTVPEMLKTLQNQQAKLKSLEERMLTCTENSMSQKTHDINESPEYMRKLRSIISAIDNIGRGNGFNACTIEQLESFMFFLSRYADLCLANCTAHIEKILDVVMNQRTLQV